MAKPSRIQGGSDPAGYSGKPLAAKLGLKAGHRILLIGAPSGFATLLGALPEGARVLGRGAGMDVVHAFVVRRGDLQRRLPSLQRAVAPGGMLWISWPKKSSGVVTDLTEDALREVLLPTGWVDVKVCAVDGTWSALKFLRRIRPSDKPGRPTAAEVAGRKLRPGA